jgi:DNA replication protein DnaC
VAAKGLGAAYASTPDLLRFVRRGIAGGGADERLDALMEVELLVLDDLGAERMTPWADEQLFVLLNARYLAERPTVLTSNERPDALPARLHSRLAELAQIVWMPVSDYRRSGFFLWLCLGLAGAGSSAAATGWVGRGARTSTTGCST